MSQVAWKTVITGRLLHVRLYTPHTNIDIVNAHQQVWSAQDAATKQNREAFWHECDLLLKVLPNRNIWVLAGDCIPETPAQQCWPLRFQHIVGQISRLQTSRCRSICSSSPTTWLGGSVHLNLGHFNWTYKHWTLRCAIAN